jgi:CHAT domain-containing protein
MPRTNALHFAAGDDHGTTLTPAGLAALDLTRSDVVVLAACSSGDGVATRSGGLFGLASALLSAGAGSVVASIWRVDDRATAPLMVAFHKRLRRGDTPVGALRHAQLEFQEAVGDVRQWGAWVVFVGSRDTAFDVRQ